MNTQFERCTETTNEWYTPPELIRNLGIFDLDPCTSDVAHHFNQSAKNYYTKEDDGLTREWFGRVWLNPPYSQPLISKFVKKMAEHNNGIALLYNRCDNKMFQDIIFPLADSVSFIENRIKFYRPDGSIGGNPGCGSVLIAFGFENTESIIKSGISCHVMRRSNKTY